MQRYRKIEEYTKDFVKLTCIQKRWIHMGNTEVLNDTDANLGLIGLV